MSDRVIPTQWMKTDLDNVLLSIVGGGTPSKANPSYYQGDIPWMSVKDMNKNVLEDTVDHISQEAVENSSTNVIPAGVPIIATRMSLGKIVVANFDTAINQDLKALFLPKQIDRNYLIWWYRSIAKDIENLGTGTTVKGVRLEVLRELQFPMAPLAEQKIIADKLDTLLAQVESIKARLERIPEILKQFRQSVLAAAVSGKLTEEWRRNNHTSAQQELNDLVNREYLYLQHKVKDQKSKTLKEKVELRGAGTKQSYEHDFPASWVFKPFFEFCLLNRGFDLPSSARTEGQYPILSAGGVSGTHVEYMVEGPCVTVGRSGSVGQVFFSEGRCWPLNTVLYVKDYGFSDPKYVYYKLIHMNLAQYASSTAVPTLNRNEFIQKLVAIPSSAEQKEIVHIVEHLFEVSTSIEKQAQSALERINNLTQSILAKAFRGELTAEWREAHSELISGENSAEALLERIKAERSIKPVTKRGRGKA
ncbi:restriction endonuclease subunit S [Acinetobacter baumannii]|uniref:restriction endonuclease subunit S n=1 Tax=Acinetobacter baumannii TaxID=470 RepID=UPI00244B8639|nr:restriction endonuclease subunit S [Acinetobacter baumannii]MDH2482347.1 restriction endonuclease subunit S [Acinetobacter baumannii]MDH2503493.1 restriction endonuclease subunit S [Acinetobacter baumannii]